MGIVTNSFKYDLGDRVRLAESGEEGSVVGQAHYQDAKDGYLIRYSTASGEQAENWWTESAILGRS